MPASSSALRRLRGVGPADELRESRRADNVAAGNENVGGVWCVVRGMGAGAGVGVGVGVESGCFRGPAVVRDT